METAAEVPVETLLCAVVAHAGAALGARDVASTAAVSRACRAAVGPHGVVRAALGSRDAGERVKGCKVVAAARVRAAEGEGEASSAAALLKSTFDALLEALLRDGEARVRREAARALWVLSGGDLASERAKAMAEALGGEALFTLEGHDDWDVNSVCFSPDGRWLASGSDDRTVRLWDVETGACVRTLEGQCLRTIEGLGSLVFSVCFSPDGRRLASGSYDWAVRLWDLETGTCVKTLEGHDERVNSVCFSPGGRWLASGSMDKTVRLWDVETGACVTKLEGHGESVYSVRFSPDGRRLASSSADETVLLWDVETGAGIMMCGHVCTVSSVCFSPDGRRLASSSWDRTVQLWDVKMGAHIKTLKGHGGVGVTSRRYNGHVNSVCFSPDGRMLASGSMDTTVKLWDVETGACDKTLETHGRTVDSVCFSPNGQLLASGSNTVRLYLLV